MFDLLEAPPSTESTTIRLSEIPAGAELAVALAGLDRDRLAGDDRVEVLKARSRLKAHVDAQLIADMVSIIDAEHEVSSWWRPTDVIHDQATAEIQAALTWTRRASDHQVAFASTLYVDYPQVWKALDAGLIDLPKARIICNQTVHLDAEVRDKVVEIALERAPRQSTGLLAARIRRMAIWVDPDDAKKRYRAGLEDRRVASEANHDGTANLFGMNMSPSETQAAMRRINRLARRMKKKGDERTIDQIRADIFLDLLNGRNGAKGRDRGTVDIRADLATLAGLSENPGEIPGFGPVVADIARQVAEQQHDAEWRYTVTDENGAPIATGTTRRRPDAAMTRRVQATAGTCVFPSCRMPSLDCDLDHNLAWVESGATVDENLTPFCRHHHVIKHHGWTITQIEPGVCRLVSPLGLVYVTRPEPP